MKRRLLKTIFLISVLLGFINLSNAQQGELDNARTIQEGLPACQGNRVDTCAEAKTQEQCQTSYRVVAPQTQCAWSGQSCYGE
jgi:hypothetical protein